MVKTKLQKEQNTDTVLANSAIQALKGPLISWVSIIFLLAQNPNLNSDAAPNYKYKSSPHRILYSTCETLQWNKHSQKIITDETKGRTQWRSENEGKRKVQGVPQSQAAALPGHQEERKQKKNQTSANQTNVRNVLRLALSLPQAR